MEAIVLDVAVKLSDATYRIDLKAHTTGVADFLFDWALIAEADGRLADGGVRPDHYLSDVLQRGRKRDVTLRFASDGAITAAIEPPPESDDREPVTPEQRRGAIDPASAVLAVLRALAAVDDCHWTVPVFDGRRRYDLELLDGGHETLTPGDHGRYGGEATRCDFRFKPIAGYQKTGSRRQGANEERTYRGWVAPALPGFPPIPVRIEANGVFGFIVVELL